MTEPHEGGWWGPRPKFTVQGHAFRERHDRTWYRDWLCKCGVEYGRQPQMSLARARGAHRAHLAEVAVAEAQAEMREGRTSGS